MFYVSAVRLQDMGEQLFIQKNGHWNIPIMDARKIKFLREEAKRMTANMRLETDLRPRSRCSLASTHPERLGGL